MRGKVYQSTARNNKDDDVAFEIKPTVHVPLLWKITLAVLVLLVILLTIGLIVQGKRTSNAKEREGKYRHTKPSVLGYKDNLNLPDDASVFQDLSEKELISVRNFLLKQKPLGLTAYDKAALTDNFIVLIENYLPPKKDVLEHLDKGGSKPIRRARVVISRGASSTPSVEEYLVEGLPNPSKYSKLNYSKDKSQIPFIARIFTTRENDAFFGILGQAASECYQVLRESFGYWVNNCTDHCLQMTYNGIPAVSKVGERKFWGTFYRRVPGLYLHPMPFQLRLDVSSVNVSKWKIDQVMYNNQMFSTISELLMKYQSNSLKKIKIPVLTKEQLLRSSLKQRPAQSSQKVTRGPSFTEPDGKRFFIDGRKVTFKDWTFHISQKSSTGLALYDVSFRGKRIAYEISVQEGAAFYSADAPQSSLSYFLHSAWGLGWSTFELIKGVDCPETATYVDAYHFVSTDQPIKNQNSICIFELNTGSAAHRHREWKASKDGKTIESPWFLEGLVDRAIVVRTVSTPYNYDYTFDYVLHENGVIEVKTAASGYALHTHYNQQEDPYGYRTMTHGLGPIHDHFILHKVDLDIAGTANSFQTLNVKVKEDNYRWETGTTRALKSIERKIYDREKDAAVKYDFDKPKYYLFINELKKNSFNTPKGYRIVPINIVKQVYPSSFFPVPAASWTKYQIAVTKYKDKEPFGSSMFNQFSMKSPVFDFESMLKDNEAIRGEDLVAWVSTGCLHIPSTEDIPVTTTPGASLGFALKPYGYFDEDPSMTSGESYYKDLDKQNMLRS